MFAVISNMDSIMYSAANNYFIADFYKHFHISMYQIEVESL